MENNLTTINTTIAGSVAEILKKTDWKSSLELKIVGPINIADIDYLKQMAQKEQLKGIDLTEATSEVNIDHILRQIGKCTDTSWKKGGRNRVSSPFISRSQRWGTKLSRKGFKLPY